MSPPTQPQEPLNNVALESAIFGLRMALTPEEEAQSRQHFLQTLLKSTMAVATTHSVETAADGSVPPNTDINMVVARNNEGVEGVIAFTTLTSLRASLPQVEHGIFMTGLQLAGILASSSYVLFVDGPELHAEVSVAELQTMVQEAQLMMQAQQQSMERNERLEAALAELSRDDTGENRELVITAFTQEFVRIPVATDQDIDAECIVINMGDPNLPPAQGGPSELQLLTQNSSLPCFTSGEMLADWDSSDRPAVVLPGSVVGQLAYQAQISTIIINPKSANSLSLSVGKDRLLIID